MDRKAIATTLAKAQAYADCGKTQERDKWARELVRLLGAAGILTAPIDETDDLDPLDIDTFRNP